MFYRETIMSRKLNCIEEWPQINWIVLWKEFVKCNKFFKWLKVGYPNEKYVTYVTFLCMRFYRAELWKLVLNMTHRDIGIIGSHFGTYYSAVNLNIVLIIKYEVVQS